MFDLRRSSRKTRSAATKERATTCNSGCEPQTDHKSSTDRNASRRHRMASTPPIVLSGRPVWTPANARSRDDQRADGLIVSFLITRPGRFQREPTVDKACDVRCGSFYLFAGLTAVLIRAVTFTLWIRLTHDRPVHPHSYPSL